MDPIPSKDSTSKPDLNPSFRKPSNEAANRKYRHHSPVRRSESSSSGSPKRDRSISPVNSLENQSKVSDDRTRKYVEKELERDPGRSHSSRWIGSHRYPDRQAYQSSDDYRYSDFEGGFHRHADEEDRNCVWSSRSSQEMKSSHSDCKKHDKNSQRSKATSRNADRYHSRDKHENTKQRSRDKDKSANAPEYHRHNDKESSRASWQVASRRDGKQVDEWDRLRERDDRERRIRNRSPNDFRKDNAFTPDDIRGNAKDSFVERESRSHRMKESYRKESDGFSVYQDRGDKSESHAGKISHTTDEQNSSSKRSKLGQSDKSDGKPSSSFIQVKETSEKFTQGPTSSAPDHTEAAQDLDAAKVAAMKAAELVNKNLVGTGFMSTDQKKKLLWGNKKSSSEESGGRWDLQLFSDRDRQEKFNKLMSLRLPWYLWPIVGCEGGCRSRAQARRKGCREAEGAADRFGEAVHCRSPAQRWSYGWPRPVIFLCLLIGNSGLQDPLVACFVNISSASKLNFDDLAVSFSFTPIFGCFFLAARHTLPLGSSVQGCPGLPCSLLSYLTLSWPNRLYSYFYY